MRQPSDSKTFTIPAAIDFFESGLKTLSCATRDAYRKALLSFRGFVARHDSPDDTITLTLLEDWYVGMRFQGLTAKTALYYLECLASMHNTAAKQGRTSPSEAFRQIKSKIRTLDERKPPFFITERHFQQLQRLLNTGDNPGSHVADIILLSLANGCLAAEEIALLKKENIDGLSARCATIARRNTDPARKYIFPLRQTALTPRQLKESVDAGIRRFLATAGLPTSMSAMETIRSVWAYIAMRGGALPSDVAAALGGAPAGMPLLSLCTPQAPDDSLKESLSEMVADIISGDPLHWFAMSLRPRVRFEDLLRRFSLEAGRIRQPEMFYPCEEIARRIGRRLVWQEKPVISDIVFFKSRMTDIYPMLTRIYDLAWCYRTDRSRGGRYASIPDSSMRRFQETIGKFTPEYEIAPSGELPLGPDDKVMVIGGDYSGHDGSVIGIDGNDGNIVYRIRLLGAIGPWDVGIDARLLKKI